MKFLFDLFPVILFFAVFKWGEGNPDAAQGLVQQYLSALVSGSGGTLAQAPIMLATAVAILATFAQVGWLILRRKKVDNMLWVSLAIITIFGGATIYFHNETFIKWKPTMLYWCFGAALLVAQAFMGKNLIRMMMEKQVALPDPVWQRLNLSWAAFFGAMGAINLIVAYSFSTAFWVNFKLFGFTALMLAFIVGQSLFLSKHVKDQQ
ncbi:septation protein A [Noviherbaspirillum aridicola]|uniref:Inner membrane-spanning protein YciB n=1 Tax=Noviherbaspirillum aridicola TaxID=2849687 RepID=A0ABQ4Q3Z1_9BURK|nr:septation protein A [Noviherbaspirillum aridicola]GIZ51530.1 putative intracellular septation protein A [Noviherbaspirillum aridicola]